MVGVLFSALSFMAEQNKLSVIKMVAHAFHGVSECTEEVIRKADALPKLSPVYGFIILKHDSGHCNPWVKCAHFF